MICSASDKKPQRAQAGVTLIEVMIVIMIMAMISLIAWRGLDSMNRSNTQLQLRTEENALLMRTLQQIERDLAWRTTVELRSETADIVPEDNNTEQEQAPANRRDKRVMLLPAGMEALRANHTPFSIEMVRAAPATPGQWQRIRWWQQGDTLYRAAGDAASAYPLPPPRMDTRIAALSGIAAFTMRAWEPGRGWRALPTASPALASATGLEVVLGIRRSAGPIMQYRRVLALE